LISALRTLPETVETKAHHVHPEDVEHESKALGCSPDVPRFTVLRNPYEQALSWFGHAKLRTQSCTPSEKNFLDFINNFNLGFTFSDRLNIYAGVSRIRYLKYIKNNLDGTVRALIKQSNALSGCYDQPTKLCTIGGGSTPPASLLTPAAKAAIERRFPEDLSLWHSLH